MIMYSKKIVYGTIFYVHAMPTFTLIILKLRKLH